MSSRLPIGVATTYSVPDFLGSVIVRSGPAVRIASAQCTLAPGFFLMSECLLKSLDKYFHVLGCLRVPLYEYQCKKCKHKFEKIQKFSDRPIRKCPDCGAPVEKVQHAPNVQFKGSGWYVTDYGGKSDKSKSDDASEKGSEKDKSEKAGSEKSSSEKKDSA